MSTRVQTVIIHKHATQKVWEEGSFKDYVPESGEFIVYDDVENGKHKVGDGEHTAVELQFADSKLQGEFIDLQSDLTDLHSTVSTLQSNVASNAASLSTQQATINQLVVTSVQHTGQIDDLDNAIQEQTAAIDELSSEVEDLSKSVDQNVSKIESDIASIEETVGSNSSEIGELQSSIETVANDLNSFKESVSDNYALKTELQDTFDEAKSYVDQQLAGKADTTHEHSLDDITDSGTHVKMLKEEREKLQGLNNVVVDTELSSSSTNPVQNKVVTTEINKKANKSTTLEGYGITDAYTVSQVDSKLAGKLDTSKFTLLELGVTSSATELNILDGATVSSTELNYVKGLSSSVQEQLNNKASLIHEHDFYTTTDVDGKLAGKSDTDHGHDVATTENSGFMSSTDKTNLNTLVELLSQDEDTVVNKIREVLDVFENYPEGDVIVSVLQGKVDKESVYTKTEVDGLLENSDYIDISEVIVGDKSFKASSSQRQIKFVAGENITLSLDPAAGIVTFTSTDRQRALATENPLMASTASVGTSSKVAREDHIHPTDTSRAPASVVEEHTNSINSLQGSINTLNSKTSLITLVNNTPVWDDGEL